MNANPVACEVRAGTGPRGLKPQSCERLRFRSYLRLAAVAGGVYSHPEVDRTWVILGILIAGFFQRSHSIYSRMAVRVRVEWWSHHLLGSKAKASDRLSGVS